MPSRVFMFCGLVGLLPITASACAPRSQPSRADADQPANWQGEELSSDARDLLIRLARTGEAAARARIVAGLVSLPPAEKPTPQAAIYNFVVLSVRHGALDTVDTGIDIRRDQGIRALMIAYGQSEAQVLSALFPLIGESEDRRYGSPQFGEIVASRADIVEIDTIREALSLGLIPQPPDANLWKLIPRTYGMDPIAAIELWYQYPGEGVRLPWTVELWLKLHRMEYLRRKVDLLTRNPDYRDDLVDATAEALGLLAELAAVQSWPVQKYVHGLLVSSDAFDDPRIARILQENATPQMSFLKQTEMDPVLFPDRVAGFETRRQDDAAEVRDEE